MEAVAAMKIGIDARLVGKGRGLGEFTLQLIRHLAKTSEDQFVLFATKNDRTTLTGLPDNFLIVEVPALYPITEQLWLPVQIWRNQLDVFHATANTTPLFMPGRTKLVLTIHDAIFMHSPQSVATTSWYQRLGRLYYRFVAPLAARRASKVVTVSKYSRDDLIKYLGKSVDTMEVVYEGVGEEFQPASPSAIDKTLHSLGVEKPYFLHLGAIDPRKQTSLTIEAFADYAGTHPAQLVITGLNPAQAVIFKNQAHALGIESRVIFPGFVPKAQLIDLFSGCEAFLFPSLSEGFGLPLLQAMACQVPVISSDATCLPEIGGSAAYYIKSMTASDWGQAMAEVLRPENRQRLVDEGVKRVRLFDWQETAQHYLEMYRGNKP